MRNVDEKNFIFTELLKKYCFLTFRLPMLVISSKNKLRYKKTSPKFTWDKISGSKILLFYKP